MTALKNTGNGLKHPTQRVALLWIARINHMVLSLHLLAAYGPPCSVHAPACAMNLGLIIRIILPYRHIKKVNKLPGFSNFSISLKHLV